jgi:hypothetical protein
MARAYGSSAHLLMKRETAYGQAATGDYIRMPFNRCNLGSEQDLIDDPVLGHDSGRNVSSFHVAGLLGSASLSGRGESNCASAP